MSREGKTRAVDDLLEVHNPEEVLDEANTEVPLRKPVRNNEPKFSTGTGQTETQSKEWKFISRLGSCEMRPMAALNWLFSAVKGSIPRS